VTVDEEKAGSRRVSLDRFVDAQAGAPGVGYEQGLAELRAGHKVTHWIWYVLPQLRALGCWRRPKTEPLLRVVPTQN
jgi:uncharacterized protein (DUF1810 family)